MNNEKLERAVVIEPINDVGSYKQHAIVGLNAAAIAKKIGFAANVKDDPNKVKFSWAFSVNGQACAVWD